MIASGYEPGTRCWVQDDKEGWVGAEVVSKDVDDTKVKLSLKLENGEDKEVETTVADIEANSDKLPPLRNPPILEATEDLTSLSYLNEPAVLHAIRMRYQQLNIYTYSGIVLIATNPFQRVDNLYTPDIIQAYSGKTRGELEPHLFAIAEDAYRCMLRDNKNQTIVVSGESGAGKTVSAKYIMRYFATVEDPDHPRTGKVSKGAGSHADALSHTEEQILATNPIMEAFGNAKTTRNDNSSRFGKYLEIQFDKNIDIIGAKIRTYLLERSRLVFQPATERNYHVFYQLVKGVTDEEREAFSLGAVEDFHYLNQGGDPVIDGVDDAKELGLTREALSIIGISDTVQHDIFKVLAALLHIGNIVIGSTSSGALLSSDEKSLVLATSLLGLDATQVAKWLVKKQTAVRSEKIVSSLNQKQALVVRDSVSKYVYSTLFDWLVARINDGLRADPSASSVQSFIGVLDIYGFEHFKTNSFEQFCINYANEKLQQEFNQHVFKLEQDEYVNEEIEWTFIEFSDNQPCITLIEAKMGILSLLDEESRLPAGSDDGFVNKLYQNFDKPDQKFFKKPRFGKSSFIVSHYAMDVAYESEGFIEKNRDTVPDELVEVLNATTNPFLKDVLEAHKAANEEAAAAAAAAKASKPGARAVVRKPTLGSIFKGSLIDLMSTINSTNVHYIRCIKPNDEKAAWKFDGPMVLAQLRACGVLETIRISCAGFPTRWTYEEFAGRYYMLVPSDTWSTGVKELCNTILQGTIPSADKYQLGKTKIFFRAGMLAYLEKLRTDRLNECAIVIQKNLRMLYWRHEYLRIRRSIVAVQTLLRGHIARVRHEQERQTRAAVTIQKNWRRHTAQKDYQRVTKSVVDLQRCIRGFLVRQNLLRDRYDWAATTIQRTWRGHSARKQYTNKRNAVVLIQSLTRRRLAIKELKQLRVEAKSVNHYKEVQYRLENKVVELTQTLDTRKQENKKLAATVETLEAQIAQWQGKHGEVESRHVEYVQESEAAAEKFRAELAQAQAELERVTKEYDDAVAKLASATEENTRILQELETKSTALDDAMKTIKEYEEMHAGFNDTIAQLSADLENASRGPGVAMTMRSGAAGAAVGAAAAAAAGSNGNYSSPVNRKVKRHSLTNATAGLMDDSSSLAYNPRPASIAIPNSALGHHRFASNSSNEMSLSSTGLNGEIERILEDEKGLYSEIVQGIISTLKVPAPSSTEKITQKEILFPANIINLVTSEMWRLGFVKESERFLGQVMQAIQDTVMKHTGEDVINPGAFWMSNVHEILSFICLAESNIMHNSNYQEAMPEFEYAEYSHLVTVVKQDLENLEFNIYHTWMKEIKKVLDKMIVPAIVQSQSLPGFVTQENTRFLSKMFQGNNPPSMDDFLSLFNKVYKAMDAYYLEPEFIKQPILELLKLVGVKSFNDLLMRRNFLSWKRGLQINYNITRIEEWCKAHNLAQGVLRLEHIMQSVKLLQLKKSTIEDIDIIYDICWTLTPAQIQKLINAYLVADYEQPISPEILTAVAARVKNDDKDNTLLLESIPIDDSGPFEIMEPRTLKRIESYIPGFLQVPSLRRLAELTAKVNEANVAAATTTTTTTTTNAAAITDGDAADLNGGALDLDDTPQPPPAAALAN